jgi:hypothetical protein
VTGIPGLQPVVLLPLKLEIKKNGKDSIFGKRLAGPPIGDFGEINVR